jgi:hypothetical protein
VAAVAGDAAHGDAGGGAPDVVGEPSAQYAVWADNSAHHSVEAGIYRLRDGPGGLGIHAARRRKPMLLLEAHDRVMGALPEAGALPLVLGHLQAKVCECGV